MVEGARLESVCTSNRTKGSNPLLSAITREEVSLRLLGGASFRESKAQLFLSIMKKQKIKYFSYGEKEIAHLKSACSKMSALIDEIGPLKREVTVDSFTALVRSVVGQQISTKAAETVWQRFKELVSEVSPDNILGTDPDKIQRCGLSHRKVQYILGIAKSAKEKDVDFDSLEGLTDEEVVGKLSSLPGVGVWTAEMLLISSLGRKDVLSFGDLGIRRGLMKLHGLEELTKEDFLKYKELYSPYGTVAAFYLWESLSVENKP